MMTWSRRYWLPVLYLALALDNVSGALDGDPWAVGSLALFAFLCGVAWTLTRFDPFYAFAHSR